MHMMLHIWWKREFLLLRMKSQAVLAEGQILFWAKWDAVVKWLHCFQVKNNPYGIKLKSGVDCIFININNPSLVRILFVYLKLFEGKEHLLKSEILSSLCCFSYFFVEFLNYLLKLFIKKENILIHCCALIFYSDSSIVPTSGVPVCLATTALQHTGMKQYKRLSQQWESMIEGFKGLYRSGRAPWS